MTLWTVACQAPLSIGFSGQECWSGLPCPPPGYCPNAGIELISPAVQGDSLPLGTTREASDTILVGRKTMTPID